MAKLQEPTQVGKREHILDVISIVDAKKYPFTSMAKKSFVPKNSLVEWAVDNYPEPNLDGALETADATTFENMEEDKAMLQGRIQIFERRPMVGRLAQNVSDVAGQGTKKAMAKSIAKGIEMLKRDMECVFCSDRESAAESGSTAYATRGMGAWLQNGAQSDLPVAADYRTPAASINTTATASLVESELNAVLESNWNETGDACALSLVCGSALKKRVSSFTQTQFGSTNVASSVRMFTESMDSRKLCNSIDIYEGDFGSLDLVLSNFLARDTATAAVRNARGYAVDFEQVMLGFHTAPHNKPLPDLGGGPRSLLEAIACLVYLNPLKGGKFAATS